MSEVRGSRLEARPAWPEPMGSGRLSGAIGRTAVLGSELLGEKRAIILGAILEVYPRRGPRRDRAMGNRQWAMGHGAMWAFAGGGWEAEAQAGGAGPPKSDYPVQCAEGPYVRYCMVLTGTIKVRS